MARGVYIHIPFCHQICNYCDFNKVFFKNQPVDEYIEAVGKEMEMVVQQMPGKFENIETIFLGGGTPTALSAEQIQRLLELIYKYFPKKKVVEFTSEANPDELTIDKLKALKSGGVNRLSMGVQSFEEHLLKKLGRTHSNEHVYETIEHAKSVGFENISIDLMYGLPGQTIEQWEDSLNKAFQLKLPHYSAYSLIVEPKTIFYIRYAKGKLNLPTEELEADMYDLLMNKMEQNGLKQYEISNFALDGYQSTHNKIYWDNDEYAGFGAGAHGYLNGERYSNIGPIKKYISSVNDSMRPLLNTHKVTREEMIEEQMFLGLRKNEGVSLKEFEKKFAIPLKSLFGETIQQLVNKGLLIDNGQFVRLSRKGRFIGNEVFQQFLIED